MDQTPAYMVYIGLKFWIYRNGPYRGPNYLLHSIYRTVVLDL